MPMTIWARWPTLLRPIIVFALGLLCGAGVSGVAAQEEGRCAPADRFLTG